MRTKEFPLIILEYNEEKNILFVRVKQEEVLDAAEAKKILEYVEEFMGTIKHYAVLDFGTNVITSAEARKIHSQSDYLKKFRIANAIVVNSLPHRLIAQSYLKLNKPQVNTRIFTEEDKAVKWLETLERIQSESRK